MKAIILQGTLRYDEEAFELLENVQPQIDTDQPNAAFRIIFYPHSWFVFDFAIAESSSQG